MMMYLKYILLGINIIAAVGVITLGLFGIYEHIMGPLEAKKLLKKLNIPWSYDSIMVAWFICLVVMIISYIAQKAILGEL